MPVIAKKMLLSSTLKFKQRNGKQKPEQFEGGLKDVLEMRPNASPFDQAGMAFEALLTNEDAIEINPVV